MCQEAKLTNEQFFGLRSDGLIESFLGPGPGERAPAETCLTVNNFAGEKVVTGGDCHIGTDNIMYHWELIDRV